MSAGRISLKPVKKLEEISYYKEEKIIKFEALTEFSHKSLMGGGGPL